MIGELTEERFLQLKIEELMIEKEHFRLLKENYEDLCWNNPTNSSYEILFKQAQDNYDLISEKLSVYNSLLMNI